MTLADVRRITRYAGRHPSLRAMVAAIAATLGVKFPDPAESASKPMTAAEAEAFFRMTGGKLIPTGTD